MIDPIYYREFDYLDDVIYLDTASVGLQPRRTLDFCRTFMDDYALSYGRMCFGPYRKGRNHVRELIARLINCRPQDVCYTANTSEGNNLLVNGLALAPGDSVITSSAEYPSVLLGWVQRQSEGVVLKLVPHENGAIEANDVIALMDETTKVVALSFVQYMTGFKADLRAIGRECRRRGIIFAVDGIQGVGRNPIDVQDMCIDVLSCGSFKGLFGTFGAAFLYCRPEIISRIKPSVFGGSNLVFDEDALPEMDSIPVLPYESGISRFEGGAANHFGVLTMGKSLEMLLEIGIDEIHEKVQSLEMRFRGSLAQKAIPVKLLGKEDPRYWSGNICVRFDTAYTDRLKESFTKNKVFARIENGFLRVALHYYNTEAQIDRTVDILKDVFADTGNSI